MACECDIDCLCEEICGGKQYYDNNDFKAIVLTLLCAIANGGGGGSGITPAVSLPLVTKPHDFFTNALKALGVADAQKKIRRILYTNNTDGEILISYNNNDIVEVIRPFDKVEVNFGSNLTEQALEVDVYAQFGEADPTTGSFYAAAFY